LLFWGHTKNLPNGYHQAWVRLTELAVWAKTMAMQSLWAALKYLTIIGRFSVLQPTPARIGQGVIYFPIVGLAFGVLLGLLNYGLGLYLASEILSIFLVAVLLVATGARHLDGTKKTFDAMALRDSYSEPQDHDSWGIAAVVLVILFKTGAIDVMDERLTLSLLLTPVVARWTVVVFMYGFHDAFEQPARVIAENVKFWHLLAATVLTLGMAVYLLGRKGLWLGLALSVFALVSRSVLYRRRAALDHDNLGAMIELSEVLALILMASL
jgi:adenosylcobinamide-GDP ribazoletransferase